MFGLGIPEIVVILVIITLIFGPGIVKRLGRTAGESVGAIREIKQSFNEGKSTIDETLREAKKDLR